MSEEENLIKNKKLQQEFLDCYINSDKKPTYAEVAKRLNINNTQVVKNLYKNNLKDLEDIQKTRTLHNAIKKRSYSTDTSKNNYEFDGFKDFYNWYNETPKACCYCTVTEDVLEKVWENGWRTKRNRGRKLEVERVDSTNNKYSSKNCKLACYFCNNHKSDFITKEHYDTFFKKPMLTYLELLSNLENTNPKL